MRPAVLNAAEARRVAPFHCRAANPHAARVAPVCRSARSRVVNVPVSIRTGQAV
jgi:hypothetical protein